MQNKHKITPRGLRRPDAAMYLGVSLRFFDRLHREGKIPAPIERYGVAVWDRQALDSLFGRG